MSNDDCSPRPSKRARLEPSSSQLSSLTSLSSLTPPRSSSPTASTEASSSRNTELRPLPQPVLLVTLPQLLIHPPNHRYYFQSLHLSLCALRKCLALPALSPEMECRAWTSLAEIGMKVIHGGLSENVAYPWAVGVEAEVDKAISKGSLIAQKHPSLRAYKLQLALLQVQFSHWQHKAKFAKTLIRNLISSFTPNDPPYIVYSAHLAAVTLFTTPKPLPDPLGASPSSSDLAISSLPSPAYTQIPQDIHAALSSISDMQAIANMQDHARIVLLSHVLRLRILVAANMWGKVAGAIQLAETGLGLSYEPATTPKPRAQPQAALSKENMSLPLEKYARKLDNQDEFISFENPFEAAIAVHTLVMSVVYFTHIGAAAETAPRLSHLHALLDSGALDKFPDGIVEAQLPAGPPLSIQVTHPRILFLLAFLVSSVAKRDAVGRKPKRKVFASEGLRSWEQELSQEIAYPLWASLGDVDEVEQRLARLKGDLLCELIAVSVMRNEFDTAEGNLNNLIAHTRTYSIFPLFAARITLHQAHLAQALNKPQRALECYRIAVRLADKGSFVALSAQACAIALRFGLEAAGEKIRDDPVNIKEVIAVAKACRGMGGTLEAVSHILEALVSPEILKAKQHLKQALELASRSQDNHMRAVVLALISSHYFHTAGDHALTMLQTCDQLAAGLGAPAAKNGAASTLAPTGNVRLGLWVGQKFLELYKRAGKDARVQKQLAINQQLEEAVSALDARDTASAKTSKSVSR